VAVDALTPAETAFVVRRLAAAAPHIVVLAPIIDRDDLVRLCREELTGVDVRAGSWDVRSRRFGVAVSAPHAEKRAAPRRHDRVAHRRGVYCARRAAARDVDLEHQAAALHEQARL
jgi:hypothetical protein